MSRQTGPDLKTRLLVHERDESACFKEGCSTDPWQLQVHHRLPRKMGGRRGPWVNSPANLILLCSKHHEWVESNRQVSYAMGFLVREGQDPAEVPVRHHSGVYVLLGHDGSKTRGPDPKPIKSYSRKGMVFAPPLSQSADRNGEAS